MSQRKSISPGRKQLYLGGQILGGVGFLLFLSNFIIMPLSMGSGVFDGPPSMAGFAFRGVGGMLCIIIGSTLMTIARQGVAGAGLILDPEQAREDLKPWNQMAGGMADDTLQEVGLAKKAEDFLDSMANGTSAGTPPSEVVKIRCRSCQALNDEQAKFCDQCGAVL